jgi:DNA modification methylase
LTIDLSLPWQVVTGDGINALKALPDGCIDNVVTDPPYGLGFPYRSYNDTRENLVSLIAGFMPEARRVAKRVFVLCGPTQIGLYPQPDWVANVTWNTTGTFGKYGFNQWTPVLCYGKDLPGCGSVNGVLKSDVLRLSGGCGVGFRRTKEETKHTCPKPITVMDIVVRRFTRDGDSVLDPFSGSGTTGVACIANGRRYVGIEQDDEYAELSRRRIAEAVPLGATA